MLGDFVAERWRRPTVGANDAEVNYLDEWRTSLEESAPGATLITSAAYSDHDLAAQLALWRQLGPLGPDGGGQEGNPPVLDDAEPNPLTPGGVLTLTGTGLIGAMDIVTIDEGTNQYVVSYPFPVHTASEIQLVSPTALVDGDATVHVIDGMGQESNSLTVTVGTGPGTPAGTPVIDSLNPGSAPAGSDTPTFEVEVHGSNFASGDQVMFDGSNMGAAFVDDTLMTFQLGPHDAAGTYQVYVDASARGGGTSNNYGFEFV